MINKELIEVQKGCGATCVVIQNEDCRELDSKIIVNADSNDSELFTTFKENISNKDVFNYFFFCEFYFLIDNLKDKYYHFVKDRDFSGYKLAQNMIIVLTVKDREGLKKISQELYHFCVVAF